MSAIFKAIFFLGGSLLIFFIHFTASNILPYPFNLINIAMATLVIISATTRSASGLLFLLPLSFFNELFAGTSFGITLIVTSMVAILIHFILRKFFTNHSIYIIFITTLIATTAYRLLLTLVATALTVLRHHPINPTVTLALRYGWEIFLTAMVTALFHALIVRSLRQFNPTYVVHR